MTGRKLAYTRVIDYLEEGIRNGLWPEGGLIPSEVTLAQSIGVSTGTAKFAVEKLTASGVLRRVPRVGTFVAEAQSPADDQDGTPESTAGSVRRSVVIVVPCLPDSYLMSIVQGVEKEARSKGIDVILRITDHDEGIEEDVLEEILTAPGIADGIIFFPVAGSACPDGLLRMKFEGYPVVVLDREYGGIRIDSIVPDHFHGAVLATEHLISLGHKRIGFVSTDISRCSASMARFNGYMAALAHSDAMAVDDMILNSGELVMEVPGVERELVDTLIAYLRRNPGMTAVCAVNDYLAVATVQAALALGMDVPLDISVTGFSNNDIGLNSPVPVTTIDHRTDAIGGMAMEMLINRIELPDRPTERRVLPVTLIPRSSTACVRS